MRKIFVLLFILSSPLLASQQFGYISYCTGNIGDDIQAVAAKRFLPPNSIPIDREFLHEFEYDEQVYTLVNGWFMHGHDIGWPRKKIQPPDIYWPPSPSIEPFFISIHISKEFLPVAFSEEGIDYLLQHAPIGARDHFTLRELRKRNIPSYFSGCLTLTLDNPNKKRDNIIYAVNLNKKQVAHLKSIAKYPVEVIFHGVPKHTNGDNQARLQYAESLLDKYSKAKCVVTSKLHATMPCLALETPVLLVGNLDNRFDGLKQLTHHCTPQEFLQGKVNYNVNNPPQNPKKYIPLRKRLIERVTNWVNESL